MPRTSSGDDGRYPPDNHTPYDEFLRFRAAEFLSDAAFVRWAYKSYRDKGAPAILRSLRTRFGLTEIAIAQRIGVDTSEISKVESGKTRPSLAVLNEYLSALHCPVWQKDFVVLVFWYPPICPHRWAYRLLQQLCLAAEAKGAVTEEDDI